MSTPILKMSVWEGTSPIIMARLVSDTNADIQQADLDSITYYIYDMDDDAEESTSTLTIASVIYDALQTGNGWGADSEGYNFRWKIPTASLPTAAKPKKYRVEIVFNSSGSGDDNTVLVAEIERLNLMSQAAPA